VPTASGRPAPAQTQSHAPISVIKMRASESPVIRKATTILLAITLLVAVVIIDGVVARYYYYSNSIRLQNAADEAISAGIVFLPANPALAFKTARQYALLNGVSPEEIVSENVAPDGSTISIELRRGIPFYLSGAVLSPSNGPVTATDVEHAPRQQAKGQRAFDL
jgi:hypothetical protein